MENKPKTKQVVRTVKEHAAESVKDKAAQVGVRTKDALREKTEEQFIPQNDKKKEQSAESSAADDVTEAGEDAAEQTIVLGQTAVRKTGKKIREKRAEKKDGKAEPDKPEATDDPKPTEGAENEAPDAQDKPPDGKDASQEKSNPKSADKRKNDAKSADQKGTKEHSDAKKKHPSRKKEDPNTSSDTATASQKSEGPKSTSRKKQEPAQISDKKSVRGKRPEQTAVKEHSHGAPKEALTPVGESPERDIKPRTKRHTPPKQRGQQTIKKVGAKSNEFRGVVGTPHKAKEVERGTKKSIKKADKAVKNAERTAKATKKATEATVKAAKRSEEAARRTIKATIQATKALVKAVIAGIKAAIAAGKELIAAIAAGGPVALVIIIVICLIAAIGGTCFGIFLSNDKTTGTQITMTEAISQLTAEHYNKITELKATYTYDSMEIESSSGGMAINWKDVLAVYAVKTTTSTSDAYEVVTMDDVKMDLLRKVIDDMNQLTCTVEARQVTETVTEKDENGNDVTKTQTVTKNILKITIKRLTVDEIIAQYGFNDEQKKQLNELMSSDYDDLWNDIIGAGGDVLPTNSTHIPTDIFAWPLQENWNITSSYGYRKDPSTGVTKFHGGTDIAAPTGTRILASADGVVEIASYMAGGYGYYVKIRHNDTFESLYGHCSVLYVTAGQQVKQGQVIADVGQTGYATGPHVHFEIYVHGVRVNAMNYFK